MASFVAALVARGAGGRARRGAAPALLAAAAARGGGGAAAAAGGRALQLQLQLPRVASAVPPQGAGGVLPRRGFAATGAAGADSAQERERSAETAARQQAQQTPPAATLQRQQRVHARSAPIGEAGQRREADIAAWWETAQPLSVPNLLSLARLFAGPVFVSWLVNGDEAAAFALLLAAGASDWADGYLADKLNQRSVLGSYLDPLADKCFVMCAMLGMGYTGHLPVWLVGVSVGRDGVLLGGSFYLRAAQVGGVARASRLSFAEFFNVNTHDGASAPPLRPLFVSKVNTVLQLALCAAAMSHPAVGWPPSAVVDILGYGMAATSVASLGLYAREGLAKAAAGAG